ncbi:MAG: MlaD family protein [Muribaculaceae bacterium]|nr:MlaD family protein [Muribaculaceae bacterium]
MKKIFRKEVIIGLISIAAIAILFFGIDFLKGVNVFKAANYYYATFENVEGLAVSAPVNLNGFKVGQVREIEYDYAHPGNVKVELSLDKELKLPEGTAAYLVTDMLGTSSIKLVLGTSGNIMPLGSDLKSAVEPGLMTAVNNDIMPSVTSVMSHVDTLMINLNTLVGDSAVLASVKRLDAITHNLQTATAQLNAMLAQMSPVMRDVKCVTGNLSTASGDVAQITQRFNSLPVDSLMDNVQQITENLKVLTEQLNNPNSTLHMITNNPALYNNLNSTVQSLDSLFVDIKKNPKRYINIKLL